MNKQVTKLEPQTTAVSTPIDMLQLAIEKGADLDQLTKLMDMKERWEAAEAKKAFVVAMTRFRAECPPIQKTRETHQGKYAGLAETLDTIKGLMSECGLAHAWRTEQNMEGVMVTCCVTHVLGHQECTSMTAPPDPSGSKNAIQAIGSTISYLERYTLMAILGMASTDQDTDGNVPPDLISADEKAELVALIKETKADNPKFLRYLGVKSLDEMPAYKFEEAKAALEKKGGK
jgi:hypothetical protein